ncbi:MAG: gamma-glutamylcyclotransferase [Proteobacteria bacterium]|nr:gamma-glutamylcyclotransferase [Pseudomonadota bacterium]MCP4920078.1 gamma-glutamylcyclotransferase [Pseudomonadota bacterium]
MPDHDALDYLAYGSNLDALQMASRCPGSELLGIERLDGWAPWFGGPSKLRGGGVLSLRERDGHVLVGRYRLTPEHLVTLDRYEGHPHFYERVELRGAWIYLLGSHVGELAPRPEYLALVRSAWVEIGADVTALEAAAQGS